MVLCGGRWYRPLAKVMMPMGILLFAWQGNGVAASCQDTDCDAHPISPSLLQKSRNADGLSGERRMVSMLASLEDTVQKMSNQLEAQKKQDLAQLEAQKKQDSAKDVMLKNLEHEVQTLSKQIEVKGSQGWAQTPQVTNLASSNMNTVATLLSTFVNQSGGNDLKPHCRSSPRASPHTQALAATSATQRANDQVQVEGETECAQTEITLVEFSLTGVKKTCCPVHGHCAGCGSFKDGKCQHCAGGFTKRGAECIACANSVDWVDGQGRTCEQLKTSDCNNDRFHGQSSKEACCQCGGGHVSASPFHYPDLHWAVGADIVMYPEPRTASRYTIDSGCELATWNLTMDASSGKISSVKGSSKPTEAFTIQCEVTAHQSSGASLAGMVKVSTSFLAYSSQALLFHTGSEYAPLKALGEWKQFSLACAPNLAWLGISSKDGTLSVTSGKATAGGVSELEDTYFTQDGAVCVVAAFKDGKRQKTQFVALKPQAWTKLEYSFPSVTATIGESLPALMLKLPTEPGLMKPARFEVVCDVKGGASGDAFSFDRVMSMGLVNGYPVLEMSSDGQITVAPSGAMSQLFDDRLTEGWARQTLRLSCSVWGVFPDPVLTPVKGALDIEIRDSLCWFKKKIKGKASAMKGPKSIKECQSSCRKSRKCAYFAWSEDSCAFYYLDSGASEVTATAKVTNCMDEQTCFNLENSKRYLAGMYCPVGRDALRNDILYRKDGPTAEDTFYMQKYSKALDTSSKCQDGNWMLRAQSRKDFLEVKRGLFELRGQEQPDCIENSAVEMALQTCAAPDLPSASEEGLQPLMLDDPSTPEPEDFWLHPCDCIPPAWGEAAPVNGVAFGMVPPGSKNSFTPKPFAIVTGQFVCPSRQLLEQDGVHFESETEVLEPKDCESRCKEQASCAFFWHGTQHGASTCRLFKGCDNLIREFSLDGTLQSMPRSESCQVSDPETCWATSLRRSFLTGSVVTASSSTSPGTDSSSAKKSLRDTPKPEGRPPMEGMVAWFASEGAGSVWRSSVGNHVGVAEHGSVYREVAGGHGADNPVTFIKGRAKGKSGFNFGAVLKQTFTICSVTRYDGPSQREVLNGKTHHIAHGHGVVQGVGTAGVAYYAGWQTNYHGEGFHLKAPYAKPTNAAVGVDDWIVLCGTNGAARVMDGLKRKISNGHATSKGGDNSLVIKVGSDWAAMEVITWDRALSYEEMEKTIDYLNWKLTVGVQLHKSERLATFQETDAAGKWTQSYANDLVNQEVKKKLVHGYEAKLTGWTHGRFYASGLLRNIAGDATAVVTGLKHGASYEYSLFMRNSYPGYSCVNYVSINGGPKATAYQGFATTPSVSGIVKATQDGKIKFVFTWVGPHLAISGIAVAKIGDPPKSTKPADPPSKGMVAWFKSEMAGSVWPSSVGDVVGHAERGPVRRQVAAGFGADNPVTFITGAVAPDNAGFNFGPALKKTFTICSVSRYAGRHAQRILSSRKHNLAHGHWSAQAPVAYYQSWRTDHKAPPHKAGNFAPSPAQVEWDTDWVVLCGTSGEARMIDGQKRKIDSGKKHTTWKFDDDLVINVGQNANSNSDFAVMEVITWDRALSVAEMEQTIDYLNWKLQVGVQVQTSQHLSTWTQGLVLDKHWKPETKEIAGDNVASEEYKLNLANGYTAVVTGFTHLRYYASGFLRNIAGSATAVIQNLKPGVSYEYKIYMRNTYPGYSNWNTCSVNNGPAVTTYQNALTTPRVSGIATPTPRGEIRFAFTMIGPHVDLSGIAIAELVGAPSLAQTNAASVYMKKKGGQASSAVGTPEEGFLAMHLYQQCDTLLLLGGMGVQTCGRPSNRELTSHHWSHKRQVPGSFNHGSVVDASCWKERYGTAGLAVSERVHCVNGEWFNSHGESQLGGFTCVSCVQVGAHGYSEFHNRNEQELYYFNHMTLSVFTELGMVKELSQGAKHKFCLEESEHQSGSMTVNAKSSCAANIMAQVNSKSTPDVRLLRLISGNKTDDCLSPVISSRGIPALNYTTCNLSETAQMMLPAEIPKQMWNLHVLADSRGNDFHKPFSSYCGTSGALNRLDFSQLFAGKSKNILTSCAFAPLIQYGKFKKSGIMRTKGSSNWPKWHHLLADSPIACTPGSALTGIRLDHGKAQYMYECSKVGGLGSCAETFSAQVEVKSFGAANSNWKRVMEIIVADCGRDALMGGIHFEFSEGGKWGRLRYQCCKGGGAPVAMEPRGVHSVSSFDGVFCPTGRDDSGRMTYKAKTGKELSFHRASGRWCIGEACSHVTEAPSPLGVEGANFDVVNVTDFNCQFEGAPIAMPKEDSLEKSLAKLKPPVRPTTPPEPKIEAFKAEQPSYSEECLDYQNLWRSITETFKNDEDADVTQTEGLKADPGTLDRTLEDYHPCAVAAGNGGIFGKIGKGDGSAADTMYKDWNDCMNGDIERDLVADDVDWKESLVDNMGAVSESALSMLCASVPDSVVAPLGGGVQVPISDICEAAQNIHSTAFAVLGPVGSLAFAKQRHAIGKEGYAACNPMQMGFARLFCDVHCVRDAVVRGDRTIIRNLERATKKTASNMQALVRWSVESSKTDMGWLADKIDHSQKVSSLYLKEIMSKMKAGDSLLMSTTQAATHSMLQELNGFAEAASFSEVSRVTAQDALEKFVQGADLSEEKLNGTKAVAYLEQLDSLHQTLRRTARSEGKAEVVSAQLAQATRRLQAEARKQREVLGIYRLQSTASRSASLGKAGHNQERHAVLLTMDHLWWQIREKLDSYLDVAEEEVGSFETSLGELASYEHCAAGFSSLASSYTKSMRVMERSHRELRSSWRQASNLIGELASVIADGEVFATFMRDEGCSSPLAQQTLWQAKSAVAGMKLLVHRFKVAALAEPDTSTLTQASHRIQESFAVGKASCSA